MCRMDPMEAIIAEALDEAKIAYVTDFGGNNPSGLDFSIPELGIEIEVKRFHSPRIAEQMSRADNVIALQGEQAVRLFASMLRDSARVDEKPPVPEVVRVALQQAEEALDVLRRGHGAEVSGACYPALNTIREANALINGRAPDGLPEAVWKNLAEYPLGGSFRT